MIITSLEPNPLELMLRPEVWWYIRYEVSNEKRAPGCLGCFKGDCKKPSDIGIIISHFLGSRH